MPCNYGINTHRSSSWLRASFLLYSTTKALLGLAQKSSLGLACGPAKQFSDQAWVGLGPVSGPKQALVLYMLVICVDMLYVGSGCRQYTQPCISLSRTCFWASWKEMVGTQQYSCGTLPSLDSRPTGCFRKCVHNSDICKFLAELHWSWWHALQNG